MMNPQGHLARYQQWRIQKTIQGMGDDSLRGIFHRHHTKLTDTALDRTENLINSGERTRLDGMAKMLVGGLLSESACRA